MTTPTTAPDLFGNLLAQMPADALERFRHGGPVEPADTRETVEDARQRAERVAAIREATWRELTPARYRSARVSDLDGGQDPHGRVSGWWQAGSRVLLIRGETGTGKTFAAYSVGHEAVDAGAWCAAWTAADLNAALRPGNDPAAYETAANCDLLIVDDLGREQISEWTLEQLHRLTDERCRQDRRLIVTTNLKPEALIDRYDDPIMDRITDGAVVVEYTGLSRRRNAAG
jgi:DNA replication protein DnaC